MNSSLTHAKPSPQVVIRTSSNSVNYKLSKLSWEKMRHLLQFGQVVKLFCCNVRRFFFQNLIWKTRISFTENLHHNYYAVFLVTSSQHRFNVCCCYSAVPAHVTPYWLQAYQEILFCKKKKKNVWEVFLNVKSTSLDFSVLTFDLGWHRHPLFILMLNIPAQEWGLPLLKC